MGMTIYYKNSWETLKLSVKHFANLYLVDINKTIAISRAIPIETSVVLSYFVKNHSRIGNF